MTEKKEVQLFTDGACSGNPGPGGWGAILRYKGQEKELSGGEPMTTEEFWAVLEKTELTPHINAFTLTGSGTKFRVLYRLDWADTDAPLCCNPGSSEL